MTVERPYGHDEVVHLLTRVDAHLSEPQQVVIIGWAAAMLGYGTAGGTTDIDTWGDVGAMGPAIRMAAEETGLRIPFGPAGVADAPLEFESRLVRVLPALRKLTVLVPEKHDLALMKMLRGVEHDIDGIARLHRSSPLDCDTLVERYLAEMSQAIGDPRRRRGNFLALIERLFPDRVGEVERRLDRRER